MLIKSLIKKLFITTGYIKHMRGRPLGSKVRKNLIDMIFVLGKAYGYELAEFYNKLFPKVTRRLIYYHLNKGVKLDELKVDKIKEEFGSYSWGSRAEKKYYSLGPKAEPNPSLDLIKKLKQLKNDKRSFSRS